jgi:hypothetical protein
MIGDTFFFNGFTFLTAFLGTTLQFIQPLALAYLWEDNHLNSSTEVLLCALFGVQILTALPLLLVRLTLDLGFLCDRFPQELRQRRLVKTASLIAAGLMASFSYFRTAHVIVSPLTLVLWIMWLACMYFANDDTANQIPISDLSPAQQRTRDAWVAGLLVHAFFKILTPTTTEEFYFSIPAHSAHANVMTLFEGAFLVQLAALVYASRTALALRNAAIVNAVCTAVHVFLLHAEVASLTAMLLPFAMGVAAFIFGKSQE